MPSDDREGTTARVLTALTGSREAFDSALARTAEEVRAFLEAHSDPGTDGSGSVAARLGAFAGARIDAARFTDLVERGEPADRQTIHAAQEAWTGLVALRKRGTELYVARVPAGGDLTETVSAALTESGRGFALARAARFVRDGKGPTDQSGGHPLLPREWSTAERALAPPLVVEVDGADLRVGGLADLLEGGQKLVLIVRGPAPPAPLARLIRPWLLVAQTADPEGVDALGGFAGPAILALMPEEAAVFSHDPRRGSGYARRLLVEHVPEAVPVRAGVPRPTAAAEDLEHLRELWRLATLAVEGAAAETPPTAVTAGGSALRGVAAPGKPSEAAQLGSAPPESVAADLDPAEPHPADRLAGWLLEQAGLGAGGGG